jgi:rod shape-determining protein MreD
MKQVPLTIPFFLALFTALFGSVFFPFTRLFAFAPFLAIVFTRTSFAFSLWAACLCGLIIDLLSSQARFGLYSLTYCLTTIFAFSQKRHFFDDKPLALALFTALISCISSFLELFLLYILNKKLPITSKFIITDIFAMSILDALYAFIWFTCSIKLINHIQRLGWGFLFTKKDD